MHDVRPRSIDWYTFVIFICHRQIFDIIVQWAETNLLQTLVKTWDWNSDFRVPFQSTLFTQWPENIHAGYTLQIIFKLCNTLNSIVTQSYIWSLTDYPSWYNLCKTKWIDHQLWNRRLNPMFSTTCVMRFVFVLCIVTSHVLTLTDENWERCIFSILPVNVLWS